MSERETPNLRWFDELGTCRCGKPSNGILRGIGNASYGPHCQKCALKRLKASEEEYRAALLRTLPSTGETE